MQINLMESDNPYSKAYHAIAELVWKACGGKEKTLTLTGTCGDVCLKAAPCHENGIEKIKLAALFQNSRPVYSDVLYRKDDLDAEEVALAIVPYCLHNSAKYNVTVAARYSLDNKTWGLREKDGKPVCVPDATVVCDPDLKTGATCDEKIASEIAGGVVAFIKKTRRRRNRVPADHCRNSLQPVRFRMVHDKRSPIRRQLGIPRSRPCGRHCGPHQKTHVVKLTATGKSVAVLFLKMAASSSYRQTHIIKCPPGAGRPSL